MVITPNVTHTPSATTIPAHTNQQPSSSSTSTAMGIAAIAANIPDDPFGSAPFSLPPGLREKAASLRKTGGKA